MSGWLDNICFKAAVFSYEKKVDFAREFEHLYNFQVPPSKPLPTEEPAMHTTRTWRLVTTVTEEDCTAEWKHSRRCVGEGRCWVTVHSQRLWHSCRLSLIVLIGERWICANHITTTGRILLSEHNDSFSKYNTEIVTDCSFNKQVHMCFW